jgi:hypothetical protein
VRRDRAPLVARLLAGLVALVGLSLLVAGVLRATVYAPETVTTGRTSGTADAAVVVTAPGALDLDGPTVRIEAAAASAGDPVFIGIGRAGDVEAYLAQAARTSITGLVDGRMAVEQRGGEATVPAPTGVDVWAVSVSGRGSAALTWPDAPGQWRMVVTGDGTRSPQQVTMTWTRAPKATAAPALIAVGLLLLVAGLVALLLTRPGTQIARRMGGRASPARGRNDGRDDEDDDDDNDDRADGEDAVDRDGIRLAAPSAPAPPAAAAPAPPAAAAPAAQPARPDVPVPAATPATGLRRRDLRAAPVSRDARGPDQEVPS